MTQEIIEARPTKKLFIETLTQDVNVKASILDLIDNSVDSYVRYKISERRLIKLTVSKNSFQLFDSCGGIDKAYLKENVFRFGNIKPEFKDATLGMYGIGLKRSIFKLGKLITLITDDGKDYCKMELNVHEWEKTDDWTIPFETESSKLSGLDKPYTEITITDINEDVKEKFDLVAFQNDLSDSIKKVYCLIIKDSIDFVVNNNPIDSYSILVPEVDNQYSPETYVETFDDILIEIVCFLDPSKGKRVTNAINQRGWNLFCNKRMILSNDTSEVTGWRGGDEVKNKSMLPKYHAIYNEFRGLVFLSSTNPFKLPLNTSKTSLNIEDKNYNYILNKMIATARPIVDFLTSKYSEEKAKEDEIEQEINQADVGDVAPTMKEVVTGELTTTQFKAPQSASVKVSAKVANISYQKEKKLADIAVKHLGAATYKEMGSRTFDYFITMEGLNND